MRERVVINHQVSRSHNLHFLINMKLKAMYTCVTRRPDSDGAYEQNESKTYQTKKLHKASKRSVFRPKWQPLSKTPKTPPKTPPKSPCRIETPPPPSTPPPPVPIEQPPPAVRRSNPARTSPTIPPKTVGSAPTSPSTIMDRTSPVQLPSPIKPLDATNPFGSMPNIEKSIGGRNGIWKSAYENNASSFETENGQFNAFPRYDPVAPDEFTSSQDDVFSRSSPAWPSDAGEHAWDKRFPTSVGESDDGTVKLLKALKLSSLQQQAMRGSTNYGGVERPLSQLSVEDDFEALKNEMMKKYGFVGVNGAVTFKGPSSGEINTDSMSSLSSSSSSLVTTSVDRATATFESVRAICDEQRAANAARTEICDRRMRADTTVASQRNMATVPPTCRRAFSVTNKDVDWSEIPPLIPPREPVRPSRNSPPHRHSSTPSPTSTSQLTPTSSTTMSFSSSGHLESSRPKYQTQSSTTTVFSALPPRMTGSNPIILPIMKDGKQESFTHYYLLGDEKSIPKSQRPPQPKPEPLNGIARPTPSAMVAPFSRSAGPAPPRPPPPSSSLFHSSRVSTNTTSTRTATPPDTPLMPTNQSSTYPPRRSPPAMNANFACSFSERSRTVPRYCDMGPGQKVVALQAEVFGVTDEECQSALRMNSWDVLKSINYLKIEQLFRVGVATRENCQQILQATDWDLQSASRLLLEQHQHNRTTRT